MNKRNIEIKCFDCLRYPYRLYYCLKEFEDQILMPFNSITNHILDISSSYTIYSTM